MRLRGRPAVSIALSALAVTVGSFGVLALRKRANVADVPVVTVRKGAFVRRVRAEGNLKAVKATPLPVPGNDVTLKIGWLVEDGARVSKGDLVVSFDPTDTTRALTLGKADRSMAESRMTKERAESGAAISNLDKDAGQALRELDAARTFQSKDPELFSRREIVEADVDARLAESRESGARKTRVVRERLSESNLALLTIEKKKAGLKITKADKELAALEIRAPHDGIVVLTRDWRGELPQVGQSVWSGQTLGEIPKLEELQAEVFVLEADAGGLQAGQRATVVLESDASAQPVPAVVKKVDALAKPRFRGVPVQYFGATLELSRTDPKTMKPGQRVVATIISSDEKEALSVPRQAVLERTGKKVVLRREKGSFVPVEVTLGPSALGRVVVTKGLSDGDVIAQSDPAARKKADSSPNAAGSAAPLPGGAH